MPEFTLKDLEVAKDMPGYSGGPAKVLRLTLEDGNGEAQQAEMFAMASTPLPSIGDKLEGEIEQSNYGPKFKRGGGRKGGAGFKRSPAETKAIQRQHSQEMALRREANLIAAGKIGGFTDDELRAVIDWFEGDIKGKVVAGVERGPMTSDVPMDTEGL